MIDLISVFLCNNKGKYDNRVSASDKDEVFMTLLMLSAT